MVQKYSICEVCGDEILTRNCIEVSIDEDIYVCGFECEDTYRDKKLKEELEKEGKP